VIHRSKGNATDLHLPPSTVPSPSAATTDQQAPIQQQHHKHHSPFLASPIPSNPTATSQTPQPFPRIADPKQNH
jgi:hypothetical protein